MYNSSKNVWLTENKEKGLDWERQLASKNPANYRNYFKKHYPDKNLDFLPNISDKDEILNSILNKVAPEQFSEINDIKSEWENIVGKDIATIAIPESYNNNILNVELPNPSWIMELQRKNKIILEKLKKQFENKFEIKMIRFIPKGEFIYGNKKNRK